MTLHIKDVVISNHQQALCDPINITVLPGEVVTLMGKSGCGKSTLLNAIAGHLSPNFNLQGDILFNNQTLLTQAAHLRHIGIIFQDDLLFPHLNIWQNLAFGIEKNIKGKLRQAKALAALEEVGLIAHKNKMPNALSGGQRARISLMRALLAKPKALLLDEPFSKLDAELRQSFREFVFKHVQNANIPTLMVTHDISDVPKGCKKIDWNYPNCTHKKDIDA